MSSPTALIQTVQHSAQQEHGTLLFGCQRLTQPVILHLPLQLWMITLGVDFRLTEFAEQPRSRGYEEQRDAEAHVYAPLLYWCWIKNICRVLGHYVSATSLDSSPVITEVTKTTPFIVRL